MRRLYVESGARGYSGYTEADLIAAINGEAGKDLGPFLRALVDEPGTPHYESSLGIAGIKVAVTHDDNSGRNDYKLIVESDAQIRADSLLGEVTARVSSKD
jgi:hypothetical protein